MNQVFVASKCRQCGRSSQFPIELLGQKAACRHCAESVTVSDADGSSAGQRDSMAWWLEFTKSGSQLTSSSDLREKTRPR